MSNGHGAPHLRTRTIPPPTLAAVLAQALAQRGIRPSELQRQTGIRIGGLLSGYQKIDTDTDRLLAIQLGTALGHWLRIEQARREWEKSQQPPKPNPALVQLRSTLVDVTGADDERIEVALTRIVAAINDYKNVVHPVVRRNDNSPVSSIVADMRRHATKFLEVIEQTEGRTQRERDSILTWYSRLGLAKPTFLWHFDALGGTLLDDIPRARKAARATVDELMARPDRRSNVDLLLLSAAVAGVLENDLGHRATTSRHTQPSVTGSRGGAGFSRILEAALVLVGEGSHDLSKLITAGLRLARDPDLPDF